MLKFLPETNGTFRLSLATFNLSISSDAKQLEIKLSISSLLYFLT